MNPAMNPVLNSGMAPVATPWFFYVLAGLAVASGLAVITRRNAVHSALALIVTLLSVAGLYLMLYAPFVAGVQIIVYAGGIMVLFLFVIMLVNIERATKDRQFNRIWPVGLAAACALLALFVSVIVKGKALLNDPVTGKALWPDPVNQSGRIVQHAAGCRIALRRRRQDGPIYVRLRDRLAAVAGGDFGRGDYDEEEDLAVRYSSFAIRKNYWNRD